MNNYRVDVSAGVLELHGDASLEMVEQLAKGTMEAHVSRNFLVELSMKGIAERKGRMPFGDEFHFKAERFICENDAYLSMEDYTESH